jgi:hypothetical protein
MSRGNTFILTCSGRENYDFRGIKACRYWNTSGFFFPDSFGMHGLYIEYNIKTIHRKREKGKHDQKKEKTKAFGLGQWQDHGHHQRSHSDPPIPQSGITCD